MKRSFFTSMPLLVKILIAIVLGVGLGFVVPLWFVRIFTTFNGLFDQFLRFFIPLIIIGLVTPAIADVGAGAKRLLIITVAIAYVATIVSGLIGLGVSRSLFPYLLTSVPSVPAEQSAKEAAYFSIAIPPMMDVMTALILSFLVGLGIALLKKTALQRAMADFRDIITLGIEKVIIPLLPIYIFGLFLSMSKAGNVGTVLANFGLVIVIILVLTLLLLVLQYSVAGLIVKRNPFRLLVTMLPAYATALGTASSAATIPITLRQALKNGVSEGVAGFVIPLCATIHLSGSMLKIVSCAVAIMLMQGMSITFPQMLGFILMLGITMIAAPGVPGGAIMAALGILSSMLGFTSDQQAMMITLYIAMDSFGTACNVTGDGAIALIVDHVRTT